jgi:hypothetical protein
MDMLTGAIGKKGIWSIDRGGGRSILLKEMLGRGLRFVVRLVGDRQFLLRDGGKKRAVKIAWGCHYPEQRQMSIQRDGQIIRRSISVGHVKVRLPYSSAVVIPCGGEVFGEKPLMLLTNVEVESLGEMRVLEIYLTLWKCEESYRFIKQAHNLEDIRVLSYTALRNMVVLVQAVFYFVSVELGKKLKLNILLKKIFEKAKKFFEIPEFKQYAIADGIYKILFASRTRIIPKLITQRNKGQLLLPFAVEIS